MDLNFFNSLTGKKEKFIALNPPRVTLYHCGPTVYDYVHVGNLRSFIFADTLRRTLEYAGFQVEQTINITDVGHLSGDVDEGEDKMTKGLKRENLPFTMEAMHTLGTKYMNAFKEDLKALNILEPQHMPRASDSVYIAEDLNLIQKLLTKGLAYETDDGIYFDTEQFTNYGALPGLPKKEDLVATPHPNKKNSRDFSLWKKNSEYGFESPYGKGFPGWHIECSAMSMRTLQTETLDIHTGGIDLAPIHHNNEIAQSEGATGKKFANFFMHSAFVDFEGGKMAKSEGNVVRLRDILKEKRHPSALRYLFLSAHYRTPVDFSFNSLNAAHVGIEGLLQQLTTFTDSPVEEDLIIGINQEFQAAIEDDLNTAKAISLIPKVLTGNYSGGTKKHILFEWDKILGLNLHYLMQEMKNIDEEINNKIKEREQARNLEDFDKADKIRKEIIELGYSLLDTGKETIALKTLALLTPSTE